MMMMMVRRIPSGSSAASAVAKAAAAAPAAASPSSSSPPPRTFVVRRCRRALLRLRASSPSSSSTKAFAPLGNPSPSVGWFVGVAWRGSSRSSSSSASTTMMMPRAVAASRDGEESGASTTADLGKASTSSSPSTRSLDLSPLRRATAAGMTLDDVEEWVSIVAAQGDNASGGGGVLTSRDAVHDVLQLARAAMKRSLRNPDRAAVLCEKLLLACLSQKQKQLQQQQQQLQQQRQNPNHSHQQQLQDIVPLHYPPVDLYNLVIMSWGSMKSLEGAQRAQQVFDLLQQSYDGFSPVPASVEGDNHSHSTTQTASVERPPRPDRRTYKSLIRAWAVSRSPIGPAKAHEWLQLVEELSGVSDLLQNASELDSSNRDESSSAIDQDDNDSAPSPEIPSRAKDRSQPPDRAMYNAVLSGYAYAGSSSPMTATTNDRQQQQPTALQQMLDIVDRMDRLHSITQSREYRLDPFSYHALLRAYSKHVRSTRPCTEDIRNAVQKIEELLRRMVRSHDELLNANADSGRRQGEEHYHDNDTADAAKAVPWSWAVGVLVEALAKSRDPSDVHLAVDYLRVLAGRASPHPGMVAGPRQQRAPTSNSRGHHHYQHHDTQPTVLRAFSNNDVEDYPSQESIWKVIQALERLDSVSKREESTSTANSSERVRDTIDEMVRIAIEAPYERIFFVNQAAEFWIQTGWTYAPDLVEQLMASAWERSRRAASLKPTGQTFAIAMRAWLRCAERDESPHRCELLFQQMDTLHQETSDRYYRPRDEHLRYVINCWLNRCHDGRRYHGLAGHLYPAEHIEAHLQWHIQLGSSESTSDSFDTSAQDWVKNAAGHYSMAIRAWSKQVVDEADSVDATDRAVRLLDELERTTDRSIPAFPCNWALEIFSQPQETLEMRKKAYDAAVDTFRRGERNARTYVLLLKVLRQQVPALDQDHRDVIEGLVKACCSSGMLTQDLIWRAVELLNAESLQRLFGLSYQYASLIVQMRDADLDLDTMSWKGVPPSALLVRNLPQEWSCNIDRQRRAPVSGQRRSNKY
jgi:hypothetical protein